MNRRRKFQPTHKLGYDRGVWILVEIVDGKLRDKTGKLWDYTPDTVIKKIIGQPLIRRTPMPRPQNRMRQQSPGLAARRKEYAKLNKEFAARPENRWCPVAAAGLIETRCSKSKTERHVFTIEAIEQALDEGCNLRCDCCGQTSLQVKRLKIRATDTHHMDSRCGKKLLDFSKCIRVSREGHRWIEQNANEARRRGWLI